MTFAFTDIEGSTVRWERHPSGMEDAVRRHDVSMRASIVGHGGHVFKTVGDAFCAAFARPQDAIAAMLAAQRALATGDFGAVGGIRVRTAVHTGTSDERDGDYFGAAVNRVARLLAIGHGGQILVSGVTNDLVRDSLPANASLRDLGEHRLRDLARPECVYQVVTPDLASDFAPLRSLAGFPNNLPTQRTSFVGRDAAIVEIAGLVATQRLVTLVGTGGIGKTRTSLHVAANLIDGFRDGVWFVELAPLTSGEYVPATIAQALGLAFAPDDDPVASLARSLKAREALLVIDNCEHLVEAAARVISALLDTAPKIKILASSRQGLGIAGETTYRLPALDLPPAAASLSACDATSSTAVALFCERARAIDRHFALTDDNAAVVAEIARRLDGIPLAIELAAARVRLLSPRELRDRLHERFRVLTDGNRDALPRQQTLRALIDWSHDLLGGRERLLFRRLGIFVDGFTIEGAVAVACGEGEHALDEFEVFDALASLVDKSLVLTETDGDASRYRLLESTRVYALERLDAAGERDAAGRAHLQSLRDRFVAAGQRYASTARMAELEALFEAEFDDVRAALERALPTSQALLGAELAVVTGPFVWRVIGAQAEGLAWFEAFAAAVPARHVRVLAGLNTQIASAAEISGRVTRALEASLAAVAYARRCDEPGVLAWALAARATALWRSRDFDAGREALREAEAIPAPSAALRMRLLSIRANLSDDSRETWERLCASHRALGNAWLERRMALNLAEHLHAHGETDRAIALLLEILPAARAHRYRDMVGSILTNLAAYFVATGDPRASATARESIRDFGPRDPGGAWVAMTVEHLAAALAHEDPRRAARLEGYADAAMREIGYSRSSTETKSRDRVIASLGAELSACECDRLLSEGATLTADEAVTLALAEPNE